MGDTSCDPKEAYVWVCIFSIDVGGFCHCVLWTSEEHLLSRMYEALGMKLYLYRLMTQGFCLAYFFSFFFL